MSTLPSYLNNLDIPSNYLYALYNEVIERDVYGIIKLSNNQNIKSIIDIGANYGIFSLYARHMFPKATIIAIEPVPEIYKAFENNVKDKNIITINKAFSDGRNLYVKRLHDYSTNPGGTECVEDINNSDKTEIQGITLTDIFKEYNIMPEDYYMIKIDCEGSEKYLLTDMNAEYVSKAVQISGELHHAINNVISENESMIILEYIKKTHTVNYNNNIFIARNNSPIRALKKIGNKYIYKG